MATQNCTLVGSLENGAGEATIVLADSTKFQGGLKDNVPEGKGTFRMPNGSRFEGEFKDGKPDGKGTFYFLDGSRMETFFKVKQIAVLVPLRKKAKCE